MKTLILALASITFISASAFAAPSNKSRFIPLLKTKLGNYKVVSANSSQVTGAVTPAASNASALKYMIGVDELNGMPII